MKGTLTLAVLMWLTCAAASIAQYPSLQNMGAYLFNNGDDVLTFSVGQALFVYRVSALPSTETAITEADDVLPLHRALVYADPDQVTKSLINRQLGMRHEFQFKVATVSRFEPGGFVWHVSWNLFPYKGNFIGQPCQFTSLVAGDGSRISPQIFLWDYWPVTSTKVYLCSRLPVDESLAQADDASPFYGNKIRVLAEDALRNFGEKEDSPLADQEALTHINGLRYFDQQLEAVPVCVGQDDAVVFRSVWAVRFVDGDTLGKVDLEHVHGFKIWVTTDGRVADLMLAANEFGF